MTHRFEQANAFLESLAGSVAALAVTLHLSGFDLGAFPLFLSAALSFSVLVRSAITKKQAFSIFVLFAINILFVAFDLMSDSVILFTLLAANGSVVAGRERSMRYFLYTSIVVSILTALVLIFTSPLNFGSRLSVGGVNPVWQSWLFAFGFVALFFAELRWKKMKLLLLGLLLIALLMTGSRQSMFGVLIAIWAGFFINGFSIKYIFAGLLISIGSVAAVGVRFSSSNDSRSLFEDAARLDLFAAALDEIASQPTGYGFGKFHYLHWDYPHNMLLELTHAAGIGGLTIFLLLIVYTVISVNYLPKGLKLAVMPILLFSFFVAQFSGSLLSHRLFYFSLGIALGLSSGRFVDLEWRQKNSKAF